MMKDNTDSGDGSAETGNIYISSEHIIQEVQKFRCLYDPSDPDHKDRDVVRDAWLTVTEAVVGEPWANLNTAEKNEAVRDFQRRWRNIKDSMRKYVLQGSTPAGIKKKPYRHFKRLKFLLETDSYKKLLNTSSEPRARSSRESSKKGQHTTRPYISVIQRETMMESDSSVLSAADQCQKEQDNGFDHPHSSTPAHQSIAVPEHLNSDWLFMFSLLPRVGALKSRDKLDFQIKVMKLLQEYDTDDTSG